MKLLFTVLVLVGVQTCSVLANSLLLTVYYESLCPDSRNFIVDQLEPTLEQLQNYVHLQLVPFGKANSVTGDPNALFRCQHGPAECLGNMVQDCTINYMQGRRDISILEYVKCEMQTAAGSRRHFYCVENAHVPVEGIQQCLNSDEGIQLQLKSEHLTNQVHPTFVPTITVNGKFDVEIQSQALVDLMGALCKFIPYAQPCYHRNNQTETHQTISVTE